jgi:hypothetical protein
MRKTYRVLADLIAILVVLQAALMVWAIAGLFSWIDGGATLDKSVIEGWETEPPTFEGAIGHFAHVMSGTFLIPLIGILLLLVSFFAKVPRGVALAVAIAVAIVVQYFAGALAEPDMAYLGIVHGINAFILFSLAIVAAKAAKADAGAQQEAQPAAM